MPLTEPQPGIVLMLTVLRADLAIVEHLLALHPSAALSEVADDLRSGITRLEREVAAAPED